MSLLSNKNLVSLCLSGKRKALTLIEIMVVVVIVALLTALSLPAIRTFFSSMATSGGTESLINAALSSARAIAAREQKYAGVRFQQTGDPGNSLDNPQYMIFVVQDSLLGAYFFRAVEGMGPMKLPINTRVMDLAITKVRKITDPVNPSVQYWLDEPNLTEPQKDDFVKSTAGLMDIDSFSILFSPEGKLVIHGVRVRNRDGFTNNNSKDDCFNTELNVKNWCGMFFQDDYYSTDYFTDPSNYGLGPEPSRKRFVVYEVDKFKQAYNKGKPWTEYLSNLKPVHMNPYTGTIVNE